MSQPTRARTTGGATPRKKATEHLTPQSPLPQSEGVQGDVTPQPPSRRGKGEKEVAFAPETLARTLRAVAAELERDPALARRVAQALTEPAPALAMPIVPTEESERQMAMEMEMEPAPRKRGVNQSFRPRLVTGASPELGSGIPDPFALAKRKGEAGLRTALDELRLGTLRAIVREHKLDPGGKLSRLNDAEKLREAILAAVRG